MISQFIVYQFIVTHSPNSISCTFPFCSWSLLGSQQAMTLVANISIIVCSLFPFFLLCCLYFSQKECLNQKNNFTKVGWSTPIAVPGSHFLFYWWCSVAGDKQVPPVLVLLLKTTSFIENSHFLSYLHLVNKHSALWPSTCSEWKGVGWPPGGGSGES